MVQLLLKVISCGRIQGPTVYLNSNGKKGTHLDSSNIAPQKNNNIYIS